LLFFFSLPLVLAGDFNTTSSTTYISDSVYTALHKAQYASCHLLTTGKEIGVTHQNHRTESVSVDYIWLKQTTKPILYPVFSAALPLHLPSHVWPSTEEWDLSDHRPIVAVLEIVLKGGEKRWQEMRSRIDPSKVRVEDGSERVNGRQHHDVAERKSVAVEVEASRAVKSLSPPPLFPSGSSSSSPTHSPPQISLQTLLSLSSSFLPPILTWPTHHNRLSTLLQKASDISAQARQDLETYIVHAANNTRVLLHADTLTLLSAFLQHKRIHGSSFEKSLYASISVGQLIDRLLRKRPLVFYLPDDVALLRDGVQLRGGFEHIGTEEERPPLLLAEYMSYGEMMLSALLSVSCPSIMINPAHRSNLGQPSSPTDYTPHIVLTACVGARLEKEGCMEWRHVLVTPRQNTVEKGYGPRKERGENMLDVFASFYNLTHFPTYNEAHHDYITKGDASPYFPLSSSSTPQYFHKQVYTQRLLSILVPFLSDANTRAKSQNQHAYIRVCGLGLGVWKIHDIQTEMMVELYIHLLENTAFDSIRDVEFCWFPLPPGTMQRTQKRLRQGTHVKCENGNDVTVGFSKCNPADPLPPTTSPIPRLLISQYAWDGNSYAGNEYWLGALSASMDPATACASTIAELQNPIINTTIGCGNMLVVDNGGMAIASKL